MRSEAELFAFGTGENRGIFGSRSDYLRAAKIDQKIRPRSHGLAMPISSRASRHHPHRSNAITELADDSNSEGLSSRVNFAASSGTSKITTHCSVSLCSADSSHTSASFLFLVSTAGLMTLESSSWV